MKALTVVLSFLPCSLLTGCYTKVGIRFRNSTAATVRVESSQTGSGTQK